MWFRVELPGVEPGSKQAAHKVSTCIVRGWFSNTGWHLTAYLYLIPLLSHLVAGVFTRPALPLMCSLIHRRMAGQWRNSPIRYLVPDKCPSSPRFRRTKPESTLFD